MKVLFATWFGGVALIGGLLATGNAAAQATATGKGEAALAQAGADNRSVYLLFYRDWDAGAQAMGSLVKAHTEKYTAKATWVPVQVTDPAERPIVEKFQVSRAPMPLVLAVHPNGAVTGAFVKTATEASLAQCLVSPKNADCVKGLQEKRLVLLCVQSSPQEPVPQGVRDFQADPHFAKRTQILTAQLNDPNEAAFFAQLNINAQAATPLTVFLAPPGVMVGAFPATASKADLAAALNAAGKCCNDANCKHHHK